MPLKTFNQIKTPIDLGLQISKFDLFGYFWPRWPFMTSWHLSSESWIQERHYDIPFTHFQSLLKFDLSSEFLTSGDLSWPRDPFFLKSFLQERQFDIYFMIFYQSSKFDLFWGFLTLSDLFWPWVTFVDLLTRFLEKLTSRASFWYTIYPL